MILISIAFDGVMIFTGIVADSSEQEVKRMEQDE
jgi:hypothetical protein